MNNVATVRGIYEAFGRQDIPAILETLDEDVSWDATLDVGVPWLRARRGRSGVAEFFESLKLLQFNHFEVKKVFGAGDTVVAIIDAELVVRATGKKIRERPEVHVWTFNERGRVAELRHAVDTLAHYRALQAS